jgi:dolichol-phosphate mannosyltransferase
MAISEDRAHNELEPETPETMKYGPETVTAVPQLNVTQLLKRVSFKARPHVEKIPPKSFTILLPALNEEDGIGKVIESIPTRTIEVAGYKTNILVVDGHSQDLTRKIAEQKGAKIVLQKGEGKGLAVRAGLESSDSDFVVMMDADNSYPADMIPRFLELLENGTDVVMGSRLAGHIEAGAMSDLNRAGNRILSFMASMLFGKTTTDVCTGMWGFNRKAIMALDLNSSGFEIEAEIFAKAVRNNLRIHEVSIRYSRREGVAKLGSLDCGFKIALKLLRKRFVR